MSLYNKKHDNCKLCERKHYAKGYCLKHYRAFKAGRRLVFEKCIEQGCNHKVARYTETHRCCRHHFKYLLSLNPRYKKDGGKQGYKDYRKCRKLIKDCCEICGAKDRLEIHHKDKNKKNSSAENIITLCRKCHLEYGHNGNFKTVKNIITQDLWEFHDDKK